MKRILVIFIPLICLFKTYINASAWNTENTLTLKDVTTKNFIQKMGYLKTESIEKICTYDYCDYRRAKTLTKSLEIFAENYLNTLQDEELKANLKVKGIKIISLTLK